MKREIKFRAWDGEQMILSDAVSYLIEFDGTVWKNEGGSYDKLSMLDNIILMQYTGLKDKNNIDVYEGDVCRFNSGGYEQEEEIKFVGNGFWFVNDKGENHLPYEREVIGNIYQNPELISSKPHN